MLFLSDQPAQRGSADKQQELSLFRRHVLDTLAAKLHCCKFAPVPCILLLPSDSLEANVLHSYI
jgi:hypothetical protein